MDHDAESDLGIGRHHKHHGGNTPQKAIRNAAADFPFILFAAVNVFPRGSNLQPLEAEADMIAVPDVGIDTAFLHPLLLRFWRLAKRLNEEALRNNWPELRRPTQS